MEWLNGKRLRFPVMLLFVCLIAYLPLSSFQFALKNDAFIYNFPNKFFFSEALHAGYLPLWNPYLNYGFPLYADPGFAWWHPVTWIFGLIGYNPYSFTIEVLFYIYIAGLGMYWLGLVLGLERTTAFAMGCMFMCSGFFIGNLQHINFLTCAAFLPWLTGAWLKYQKDPSVKTAICCAGATYLLCTGGHPAIPIASLYFFFLLTVLYYLLNRKETFSKPYISAQLKLFAWCVVFLLPLLLSYAQLLPLYSRSLPDAQTNSLQVGFTVPSYLSFLLPFGTIKNPTLFATDVSMRNAYFSLAGFVLFLQVLGSRKLAPIQIIFLISGLGMLLLAAGGVIKSTVYQTLPLLQFIRTNGEFRVFTIFSFIICLSYRLNVVLLCKKPFVEEAKKGFTGTAAVLAVLCLVLFFVVTLQLPSVQTIMPLTSRLKFVLDYISFGQTFFIAAVTAFILALAYRYSLQSTGRYLFLGVLLADLILNSWLLLPVTGVSQHAVAEMQRIINKSPEGLPLPPLRDTLVSKPITPLQEALVGNWNWYSKQIVYKDVVDYPSRLKAADAFQQSKEAAAIKQKPVIFLKNGNGILNLTKFSPVEFELTTALRKSDTLVFLQNWYPGWGAWVNGKETGVQRYLNTFLQLPVDPTTQKVRFRFSWF